MIEKYEFGKIKIDGKEYNEDVRIFPDKVKDWWRKEGHNLCMDDLSEVIEAKPEKIIIGRGHDGMMNVDDSIIDELKNKGFEVYAGKTGEAVEEYNKLNKEKTVACLHLTC